MIAVTHPADAHRRKTVEQLTAVGDQLGLAELTDLAGVGHLTACHIRDELTAVSDAEDRQTRRQDRGVAVRRVRLKHTVGTTGEDDAFIALRNDLVGCDLLVRHNLGIDVLLSDLAGDRLVIMTAEIQYQYFFHGVPSF